MDAVRVTPDVPLLLQQRYPEQFRKWLRRGALFSAAGYTAAFLGSWLGKGPATLEVVLEPVVIVACLLGAWLSRTGKTQSAAWVILSTCWLEAHVAFMESEHGLRAAGSLVLPVLVLGVALLLGRRAAAVVAGVTALTAPLAVLLGHAWLGKGPGLNAEGIHQLLSLEGAIFTVLAVVFAFLQTFAQVLFEADSHERRATALVEQSPDCMLGVSDDGRILSANGAATRLFGMSWGQLEHQPLSVLGVCATGARGLQLRDGCEDPVELRIEGTRRVVEALVRRMDLGHSTGWLIVLRDVTRRKELEEQAGQLESQLLHSQKLEALGQLAGGVAHDFNNLLTIVAGYATLLQRDASAKVREYGQHITEAQQRGATLTRQLLTFARREVVNPRPLCLTTLLRDLWPLVRRAVPESIALHFELEEDCYIVADPGQVEQVVLNLAANARDAMGERGELRVACARDGEQVRLTVADNGRGMSAEVQRHIFEPFFTTKERGKGTGLGLATVSAIVSQQGGKIEVESRPGEGTCFTLSWPVSCELPVESEAPSVRRGDEGGRERILIAEDDEAVRHLVEQVLRQAGYQVLVARDGKEAVSAVLGLGSPPDLVVTDVIMPGMNGIDVVRRLRLRYPSLRALYTSGYLDDVARGIALDPGKELLAKPFTASELLRRIRMALDAAPASSVTPEASGEGEPRVIEADG